ncbi:MAG TPA: hypothetical protein VJN94_09910 [Candidatus Binataceae bacterium]|nr:hypothetical protein [Candidatus Binataceae bacterium]
MSNLSIETGFEKNRRANLAIAFTAILLIAQLLAAAHYHRGAGATEYSASIASSLDNGLCALCLLNHYSPTVSAVAPLPNRPTIVEHIDLYAAQSWPLYSFCSYLPGRAPPLA